MEKSDTFQFRICVIGDHGVGKTQIIYRYVEDRFEASYIVKAFEVDKHKIIHLDNKEIKLQIYKFDVDWDRPGNTPPCHNYQYRADGFILIFDLSDEDAFYQSRYYLEEIESYTSDREAEIILVGNKCDLTEQREIDQERAEALAEFNRMPYIETSAKDGTNVQKAFETLIRNIMAKRKHNPVKSQDNTLATLDVAKQPNAAKEKQLQIKEKHINEKILRKNLNKAKKDRETIPIRVLKLVFTGSPAAGKTSFINLLLKRKFNSHNHSTNNAYPNHVVSVRKAVFHGAKVTWTELDTDLEISYLHSMLLPNPMASSPVLSPAATKSLHLQIPAENITSPSKPAAAIPLAKPHQSSIKHRFTGYFVSAVRDSNLSTFNRILDATESQHILHQPGEVLNIITLLDTGGQPEYIHLLPTININTTVTFVIHDLSKSLSDQVLMEYSQHGKHVSTPHHLNYSNLDMIKLLMSSANDSMERPTIDPQLVLTPGSDNKSYICLVGTHADKVSHQTKMEVERELNALVNITHCETVVWQKDKDALLFPVKNTSDGHDTTEDPVAYVIRKRIEMLAREKDIYEVPITWILLELEIRQACSKTQKAYISFLDCVTLARETGLISKEEVKNFLLYHHLLGVLIYFDEIPGLCDYVIVDHQWWLDKLSRIMSITFYQTSLDDHYAVQRLKCQGLLSKEVLQHVEWKDDIKMEFFLSLLVHMKVVVPIVKKGVEEYFIPFILPTCNSQQSSECLVQYGHLQGSPLLIHLQSGPSPRGFFYFLVAELLKSAPRSWQPRVSDEEACHTFSNLITFQLRNGYFLSLLDKVSHLEVHIRHAEKDFSVPVHNKVYNYLVFALTEVCIQLNLDFERLQYGFVCQCGKGIDNHVAVIPYITPSMYYAECSINSSYYLKLDSSHLVWFFLVAQDSPLNHSKPLSSSGDQVIANSVTEHIPNQPALKRPAMRLIHEIVVPRIAADWSIVADYLEYEIEYKQVIKEKCHNDPMRCCVELLEDWLSSDRGVSPKSWSRLIEALKGIKSLTATTEMIIQDIAKAGVVVME